MPANLTQQYRKAEQAYREATTLQEELSCLQTMLVELPKHKIWANFGKSSAAVRRAL